MRISLAGCSTTGPCAVPGRIIGRDCCSSAGGSFSLWIAVARTAPRRRGGGPRPIRSGERGKSFPRSEDVTRVWTREGPQSRIGAGARSLPDSESGENRKGEHNDTLARDRGTGAGSERGGGRRSRRREHGLHRDGGAGGGGRGSGRRGSGGGERAAPRGPRRARDGARRGDAEAPTDRARRRRDRAAHCVAAG